MSGHFHTAAKVLSRSSKNTTPNELGEGTRVIWGPFSKNLAGEKKKEFYWGNKLTLGGSIDSLEN